MGKFLDIFHKIKYIMSRPQKILAMIILFMTCIGSVLECLGTSIIIPLVNVIQNPVSVTNTSFFKNNYYLNGLTYSELVLFIGGCVVLLYVFKNIYFIILAWVRIKFSCKIQRETAISLFISYMSRGYQFFLGTNFGELRRGVSDDAECANRLCYYSLKILSEALSIILICGFMVFADWQLATAMFFMAFVCVIIIYFVFRKKMYKAGEDLRKYSARGGQALIHAFQGTKDVLLLRKQGHFIYEYEKNQIKIQEAICKQTMGAESPAYIIEGLCIVGLMTAVCGKFASGNASPEYIAILAAFAVGAFRILPSLGRISASLNMVMNSIPGVNSVYEEMKKAEEFLQQHPEMAIKANVEYNGLINKGQEFEDITTDNATGDWGPKFNESLVINNVSFAYNDEAGNIIDNLNLEIKKGTSIAIIGESGAGKSTLVDVLLGLLIPDRGQIYMDGVDIRKIPELWSRTVGYVPQSVFLSAGSIKANVAFGESDERIDETRVKDALTKAKLNEFVNELPEGIETYVGDRGIKLSGGQRQRIAIARALYHKPEIMVLDEATSALDNETEEAVMDAIEELQGEVTMVIVAHRLTTIRKCDVIYEVKNGKLIERKRQDILV